MRHPQYVRFIMIMIGFLLQWPTLLTLTMVPVLVTMYVRLARREEREVHEEFGGEYDRYATRRRRRPLPRWTQNPRGSRYAFLRKS